MELNTPLYKEDPEYRRAVKRVKALKGFYGHLAGYLIVNLVILIVSTREEGLLEGLQDLSNYFTAFFWGIGLLAHAAAVFMPNILFGREWEERKIKEFMEKEKQNSWE
ncbi:MAG: 2TM domain-containing protein [Salinimicrobium sediminis]|uniref:2TM domain-containing protein n=1 Tax=Salinimicrobium sediminis TaxID=1343891 RepID=A0A285X9G6_9FLAO|nr:2TM domain-containing protein [Salinimicrobium sediminis]MDX1602439.1 2TM domain-containing protein [Salinimicrobium sediminis]MDX1752288.1 2TM domain-containing protein [Salinimicrobium sediminis]SOC81069.1 2TM domain-containing protein [Salinimicrobium sediminis]